MGLGDLTLWQWGGAVTAALLVGLSKAGFGTGAGLLAVPLMVAVLGPETALSIMLLVLITGDVFSLIHYRREHDTRVLAMLIPGLVLGVVGGSLVLDWFRELPGGEVWMKRVIGLISIAFVGIQGLRSVQERRLGEGAAAYRPAVAHGVALGAAAGVTSTLAHAGGPLIALFLLPQKLPKKVLVGTMLKYFFVGNLIKLVPYSLQGMMTAQNGLIGLALVPAVVVGTLLGLYLQGKFSDRAFRLTVYGLALLLGLYFLLGPQSNAADTPRGDGAPAASVSARPADAFQQGLAASGRSAWEEAAASFRRAGAEPGPWQEPARFNQALALYRAGRFERACDLFAALSASPGPLVGPSACLNAGNCAYRLERWDEAAGCYARALGVCRAALTGDDGAPESVRPALREVAERARFNLGLARRRASHGAQAASGTAAAATGGAADGLSGDPATTAGTGRREAVAGPALGHEEGAGQGRRELAGIMAYVTGRDTGPVLRAEAPTPVVDGKTW